MCLAGCKCCIYKRKDRRKHGLQPPLDYFQIIALIGLTLLHIDFFLFVSSVSRIEFLIPTTVIYSILALISIIAQIIVTFIDAVDPHISRKEEGDSETPTTDESPRVFCQICESTVYESSKHCKLCLLVKLAFILEGAINYDKFSVRGILGMTTYEYLMEKRRIEEMKHNASLEEKKSLDIKIEKISANKVVPLPEIFHDIKKVNSIILHSSASESGSRRNTSWDDSDTGTESDIIVVNYSKLQPQSPNLQTQTIVEIDEDIEVSGTKNQRTSKSFTISSKQRLSEKTTQVTINVTVRPTLQKSKSSGQVKYHNTSTSSIKSLTSCNDLPAGSVVDITEKSHNIANTDEKE
ncbi:hypothetical protein ABK040_008419 [Willaertia magna]